MALTFAIGADTLSASGNAIPVKVFGAFNWQSLVNYKIRLRIEVEKVYDSGTYEEVFSGEVIPAPDGAVEWNLRDILSGFVSKDPPAELSPFQPKKCENQGRRYRYFVEELEDGTVTDTLSSAVLYIYRGAFNYIDGQNLTNWVISEGRFLTFQPRGKPVSDCSPEWLKFIIPTSATTARLMVEATLEDNSTETPSSFPSAIPCSQYDVILFASSYEALELDTLSGPVKSWKVWVEDQSGTTISEEMTYILDPAGYSSISRFWIWENRLGGYDTLMTTGELTAKKRINRQTAEAIPSPVRTVGEPLAKPIRNYSTSYYYEYDSNSGFMTREGLNWAQAITTSEDVFLIEDYQPNPFGSGTWRPVNMIDSSVQIHRDNDFLRAFRFKSRDAFASRL